MDDEKPPRKLPGRLGRKRSEGTLSTHPTQIRNRLRRQTKHMDEDLEALYAATNYKPVDQWDLEELAKGRPRQGKNGSFRPGVKPTWITPKIHAEIRRRLMEEGFNSLASHLVPAIQCLADMLGNEQVDEWGTPIVSAKTKVEISKFIIEQILGKARQRIDLGAQPSFRDFLAGALVLPGGKPAHPVVEGTVVEDTDDEEDEEYDD